MKPIGYTREGDKVTYHYTFKQLREFLTHGFQQGNNGLILVGQDKKFFKYKGFGTIHNPWHYVATVEMENDSMFNGEMPDPKEVVNPPESEDHIFNVDVIIWDASEHNDVKLPVKGKLYKDDEETPYDIKKELNGNIFKNKESSS